MTCGWPVSVTCRDRRYERARAAAITQRFAHPELEGEAIVREQQVVPQRV
jgi:hypothetical protein